MVLSLAVPIYSRVAARFGAARRLHRHAALLRPQRPDVLVAVPLSRRARAVRHLLRLGELLRHHRAGPGLDVRQLVFDTRQARRLFGLIGSGASLGAIAGGLLARELARRVGTINLLLVLAALIALAAVVVNFGWRVRRRDAARAVGPRPRDRCAARCAIIGGSRYLRLLAAMVFVVAIVTQWTQFQFSLVAEARARRRSRRLTRFFGSFNSGSASSPSSFSCC